MRPQTIGVTDELMRTQCPYHPAPMSSIFARTLGCRMARGRPKAMVMPWSLIPCTREPDPAHEGHPHRRGSHVIGSAGGDEPFETVEQLAGSIPLALQESSTE